jgi:HK97 family phage major capsid protein
MSKAREQALLKEIEERASKVTAIWDKAGDATLDEATKKEALELETEIAAREKEIKEIRDQDELRQRSAQRQKDLTTPVNGLGAGRVDQKDRALEAITPGQQVLTDPEFKAWRERMLIGGAVTKAAFGHSPRVAIPGGLKTLLTGASNTSAGALVYPQFLGVRDMGAFMRPLTIRDIITNGTTESDLVEYVRITGYTNNAAPTAEATATSGSSGSKPESALETLVISEPVKTVAHWIPATRRAIADAGQLRTLVNSFLIYGLEEELEDQVLNGSGVGDNFTGVHNVSGITPQAFDTDILTTTRRARTKVRVTGRATPTAYVLHPNDWEDLDLTQDNEARYYFGGPSILGNPRLWGLPVVESEGETEGQGMVADWRLAVLWDREVANILMSDSHADFFVRNMIAILAELRAAFGVLRPAAFVEIDLTP